MELWVEPIHTHTHQGLLANNSLHKKILSLSTCGAQPDSSFSTFCANSPSITGNLPPKQRLWSGSVTHFPSPPCNSEQGRIKSIRLSCCFSTLAVPLPRALLNQVILPGPYPQRLYFMGPVIFLNSQDKLKYIAWAEEP